METIYIKVCLSPLMNIAMKWIFQSNKMNSKDEFQRGLKLFQEEVGYIFKKAKENPQNKWISNSELLISVHCILILKFW